MNFIICALALHPHGEDALRRLAGDTVAPILSRDSIMRVVMPLGRTSVRKYPHGPVSPSWPAISTGLSSLDRTRLWDCCCSYTAL